MIRKNLIMIESDHKSSTLFLRPRQKVGGGKNIFTRPKIWKSFSKVMHFYKTVWEISEFFIISHILNFWKMLFRSLKKVCDEFSKIKNLWCTFLSFFRADRRGIWLFFRIKNCLVENWPRNGAIFSFCKNSKISQNVFQKSTTVKNDFLIFGHVKKICGSEHIIFDSQLFVGGFSKCFQFYDRFRS